MTGEQTPVAGVPSSSILWLAMSSNLSPLAIKMAHLARLSSISLAHLAQRIPYKKPYDRLQLDNDQFGILGQSSKSSFFKNFDGLPNVVPNVLPNVVPNVPLSVLVQPRLPCLPGDTSLSTAMTYVLSTIVS